jgi:hypothetical protein
VDCSVNHRPTWEYILKIVNEINLYESDYSGVYGIPTGGSVVAALLYANSYNHDRWKHKLLDKPEPRCLVIDDIIDSGKTLYNVLGTDTAYSVHALYCKSSTPEELKKYAWRECTCNSWIHFPWEHEFDAEAHIRRLFQYRGIPDHEPMVKMLLESLTV